MTKIALVSTISEAEEGVLTDAFDVELLHFNHRRDDLAKEGDDIDIIYGNVRPFELPSLPNLKWVHATWAGIENLCYPELIERDPIVTNIRGAVADAMSEHAIAGLLHFIRDLPEHDRANKQKQWSRSASGSLIKDSTILVMGTGGIGKRLIEILSVFGARLIGVNSDGHDVTGCEKCIPLDKALAHLAVADHVICTLPCTPSTRGFFNRDWFAEMKPGSVFVNISRGAVVNEADLIEAVQSNKIRGAFLDVTDPEPLPEDSALWNCDNIFITGHRSYLGSRNVVNPAFEAFKTNLGHFLNSDFEQMIYRVNLKSGY